MNSTESCSGQMILLVEDDPDIRVLAEMSLQVAGLEVDTCEAGSAALSKLEQRAYNLVILDVMMPDLSGYDVMKYIEERLGNEAPPVALFSARPADAVLREACKYSMRTPHVLMKPFDPVTFASTVKSLLRA